MSTSSLNRRDFLKLTQLLPLLPLVQTMPARQPNSSENADLPNILIILFDTLSARHMSLYGYPRQTTPNIERAAEAGATVFHRHYAGGSYTPTGTASLLTGTYPWTHRALHPFSTAQKKFKDQNLFHLFHQHNIFAYSHNTFVNLLLNQFKEHINLLEKRHKLCLDSWRYADRLLTSDNFQILTQAEKLLFKIDGNPSSHLLSRFLRSSRLSNEKMLNQQYKHRFPRGVPNFIFAHFTIETAINWIQTQTETQKNPYLGYIHLVPPHHPYTARYDFIDKFRDNWQPLSKPESVFSEGRKQVTLNDQCRHYDEFIGYVDAEFGRLFTHLKNKGALDNTYLILTSDHGEMFERGIWGHITPALYEPLLHIPLLIWQPGQTQRFDIHKLTSCVDVLPTLLQITKQPIPSWCEGRPLPSSDNKTDTNRNIFAVDSKENSKFKLLTKGSIAHYKAPYKLSYYFGYKQTQDFFEFYNIEDDLEELNNLSPQKPSIAERMREELLDRLSESNRQFQR